MYLVSVWPVLAYSRWCHGSPCNKNRDSTKRFQVCGSYSARPAFPLVHVCLERAFGEWGDQRYASDLYKFHSQIVWNRFMIGLMWPTQ